jgi:hypothetical protein
MIDKNWFPPTSLKGKHWRVEVLGIDGTWCWYTEHMHPSHAESFCKYKIEYHPHDQWRVVEAFR